MIENWKKIFSSFKEDKDVKELYEIAKSSMLKAGELLDYAIKTLRKREGISSPIDVYEVDKQINNYEVEIRRKIFLYLTTHRPVKNYRVALIMSLISHDMERVGDYAKNIFDISKRYGHSLKFGQHDSALKEIEELIQSEFKLLTSHLVEDGNENVHKSIGQDLTIVNKNINVLLNKLHDNADNTGLKNEELITLVLYLRFLKRISSHLRNIASSYYNPIDRIGFSVN